MKNKARNIENCYHYGIKHPMSFQKELSQDRVNENQFSFIQINVLVLRNLPQSLTKPLLRKNVFIDSANPEKVIIEVGFGRNQFWLPQISILYHPHPTLSAPSLLKALCSFTIKSRRFSFNISCDFP